MSTPSCDVVLAAYLALDPEERAAAFKRIRDLWTEELAGEDSEAARFLRSLKAVAAALEGATPTVEEYKEIQPRLVAEGQDVEPFSRLYRHYGTWPRAREALELSGVSTVKQIEARFRHRRLGKISRYTEATLRDAMTRAAEHWGRPPSVAEFEWWREREMELAITAGKDDTYLPSSSPYRKRWGTWETALLHFGFTPEEVALRLDGKIPPYKGSVDQYLPEDLPIARLDGEIDTCSGLTGAEVGRLRDAFEALSDRSKYILTVRLGLGGTTKQSLKATGAPLCLSLDRIRQIQVHAVEALVSAVAGEVRSDRVRVQREAVIRALSQLAG